MQQRHVIIIAVAVVAILAIAGVSAFFMTNNAPQESTEALYIGNVITMDEENPTAEAFLVKDGKITYIGSEEEARKLCSPNTEIKNFGSKYIYPGMIDVHSHIGLLSTMMGGGALFQQPNETYEQTVERMTKYIKENQDDREIYKAYCFTPDPKRGPPTHNLLNAIEIDGKKFDKPIVIVDVSGHQSWMNQVAMDKFGVNKKMVEKYGRDVVPCDENGDPIGCVKETPHFTIMGSIPVDLNEAKEMFLDIQTVHLADGYSMIGDCGLKEGANQMVTAMAQLAEEGKLKLKIRAYYEIMESCEKPLEEVDRVIEFAKKYNYDTFKIVGIKIFLDGVNEGMTSWTLEPYVGYQFEGKPYDGFKRWNYDRIDELAKIIEKANENGLSVELHAIGSGAARYALDAIELAQEGCDNPDFRNAVSHLYYVDKEDIPRFAELNVSPVTAPQWYVFTNETAINAEKLIYGDPEKDKVERKGYLDIGPLQSHLDAGSNMAFHSDGQPGTSAARIIFTAVNKYDPSVDPKMALRNIEERISAYDAVKCLTVNSAYVLNEEENVGMLKVGMQADFVVYDINLTDDEAMKDPKACGYFPVHSYINGKEIILKQTA